MKEFDLFGFQVQIDEVATREWYEKADEWGCECEDCRHFIDLAKRKELPVAVMEILGQFGFSIKDETYGYNMTKYCGYLLANRQHCRKQMLLNFGMSG